MRHSVWFNSEAARVKFLGRTILHIGPRGYWKFISSFPSKAEAEAYITRNRLNRDSYKVWLG